MKVLGKILDCKLGIGNVNSIIENLRGNVKTIADFPRVFFEKTLPDGIIRPRFVWVVLLGCVTTLVELRLVILRLKLFV